METIKDESSDPAEGSLRCGMTEDEEHPGATSTFATAEPQTSPSPNQVVTQSRLIQYEVTIPPQSSASNVPSDPSACDEADDFQYKSKSKEMDTENILPESSAQFSPAARSLAPSGQHHIRTQDSLEVVQCHSVATSPMTPPQGDNAFFFPKSKEMDKGTENILPESSAQFSPLPCSPAPSGQHHIRTQVSLEVVQCHSVATSPIAPPQGDNAFSFPDSSGRSTGATNDAERQVGRQEEYRSVATAPMTPKTPTTATFPELTEENTRGDVEARSKLEQPPPVKDTTTLHDGGKHYKQHTQRIGSMDQDITILVTHHGTLAESEEGGLHTDSSLGSVELEVKIDECNEMNAPSTEAEGEAMNTERHQRKESPMDEVPTANTNEGQNFDSGHEQEAPTTETQIKIKHVSSSQPISEPTAKEQQSTHSEATAEESFGEEPEKVPERESPMTPNPVPCSPAPSGFQHIRTQVSLEVVQCHSVATSPMTPPQGDNAFSFPTSSGPSGATGPETKDAELQVGRQVEYRSVATAPMTPKTPTFATFPEISRKETEQMGENTGGGVEMGGTGHVPQVDGTVIKSSADSETGSRLEWTPAVKDTTATDVPEATSCVSTTALPKSSVDSPPIGSVDSQATLHDSRKQSKQHTQKMGSMDQDITILVTHHGTLAESEEGTDSSLRSTEQEVKIDECNEINERTEEKEKAMNTERHQKKETLMDEVPTTNTNDEGNNFDSGHEKEAPTTDTHIKLKHESSSQPISEPPLTEKEHLAKDKTSTKSGVKATEDKSFSEQLEKPESSMTPNPVRTGFQHIQTQVSLEVVQCHSVATSPMTPPQGDNAFFFPTSSGPSGATGPETKDRQIEFRSVATGPMTPRTPTAPSSFHEEIVLEKSVGERIAEEEQDKNEKESTSSEAVAEDKVKVEEDQKVETAAEKQTATAGKEKCEEKCEEPVQKVNWDEKGMTWEVYGAVVEVAVLGSAIQKHLEKQVKKHRNQPSMPPPPPLMPTAVPLTSASPPASASGRRSSKKCRAGKRDGKLGRRRRNPFRLLLRNMQQPICCSRAHAAE